MRKVRLSQLGGVAVIALLASFLIVVAPREAGATSRPVIKSFKVTPSSIGGLGAKVTVTAKVKLARTCAFSIAPHVAGLPVSKKCRSGSASVRVSVPENPSRLARVYSVTLTVTGATGKVSATKKIVEAPRPLTGVVAVVGQQESYCALLESGRVDCWGDNGYGQLGNGTTKDADTPTAVKGVGGVATLTGVAKLISGPLGYGTTYCALLTAGGVDCWGFNADGQLGNGTTTTSRTPTRVKAVGGDGTLADVTQVQAEEYGFCARLSSGVAVCWGQNDHGQLGDATFTGPATCGGGLDPCSPLPVNVVGLGGSGTLTGVTSLVGESVSMCALLSTHDVDCWGYGSNGQLGDGSEGDSDAPSAVKGVGGTGLLTGVAALTGNENGSSVCARLSSGRVDCWGDDAFGELGDGTKGSILHDSAVPVAVRGPGGAGILSGVAAVVAIPGLSNCAILTSGGADCWGYNGASELGNGSSDFESDVPVKVVGIGGKGILGHVGSLTGSTGDVGESVCARLAGDAVACWGEASSGFSAAPKQVAGPGGSGTLTASLVVSDEDGSNCALRASGEVVCWGQNVVGQLGDGSTKSSLVPEIVVAAN